MCDGTFSIFPFKKSPMGYASIALSSSIVYLLMFLYYV